MKKLVVYLIMCTALISCLKRGSVLKHETGFVVAKQFQGEINASGSGVGMSTGGDFVVTSHTVHQDEQFDVVFKCEHGIIFTINDKDVYAKLKEYDTVIIDYYEMLNDKGEVKDFDFIDANKIHH